MGKTGILVVSHGSSSPGAVRGSIDVIYHRVAEAFPQALLTQAYYAPNTLRKFDRESAQTPVQSVEEALQELLDRGVTDLRVLMIYLTPGAKYDRVAAKLEAARERFSSLMYTPPLLAAQEDVPAYARLLVQAWQPDPQRALVLSAHSAVPSVAPLYAAVCERLRQEGYAAFMAYRNGSPSAAEAAAAVRAAGFAQADLCAGMLMRGRHHSRDLEGRENSTAQALEAEGIGVRVRGEGLAQCPAVQEAFVQRLAGVMN